MGGSTSTLEQSSSEPTLVRVPRYTLEEKRKKQSKFNTLKKKLSRSKSGFKSPDHGKMLRELTQTWTVQEINALVEEYEAMMNVKELKNQTNLVRQSAPSLKKDLLRLLEEGICADTTLIFENTQFHVHKAILTCRCPYFKDLLSQHTEQHPVIQMEFKTEGMTTEIFSALLCYLYTGDFMTKKSGLEYIDVLMNLGEEFGTPNVLEQDLNLLFKCGEYADVAFVFPAQDSSDTYVAADGNAISDQTYEILCHKAVLCARSHYFRSLLLKSDLGSNDYLKTGSGVKRLVLDESVITRQYTRIALQCMYTDSVDLSSVVKWSSEDRKYCSPRTHKLLTSAEIAMEVFEVASFIDLPVLIQGCEDIILEELSPSTLLPTLEWSSLPHGSDWVYRQAMHFLQEEFVNIAQSDMFTLMPRKYLIEALKSDFLQACEHNVLLSVIKWGEAQVIRQMNEQDPVQDNKKNAKRRDIDNKQLKRVLAGVIEHVRIGHVLPPHSELLDGVFRRGLVDRGMPLDIGEGNFYPNLPWMRRREEKDFVRPRLFLPYFEEAKAILEEHKEAEKELIRNRMLRVPHNMPDTLYMVESHKRTYTAPAISFASSAAGRLERDERRPSVGLGSNRDGNELERYMRCGGMNEGSPDEREPAVSGTPVTGREFALPDVAMEAPSCIPDVYLHRGAGPSAEIYPVPDVALPSSPTSSVSSSSGGVPPEYFHMDHLLESLDDDGTSESS